jgi:hypothetical protein
MPRQYPVPAAPNPSSSPSVCHGEAAVTALAPSICL